ncbi:MAG: hypothetical protein AABW71_01650 [Nanoarchaeota archaeon]
MTKSKRPQYYVEGSDQPLKTGDWVRRTDVGQLEGLSSLYLVDIPPSHYRVRFLHPYSKEELPIEPRQVAGRREIRGKNIVGFRKADQRELKMLIKQTQRSLDWYAERVYKASRVPTEVQTDRIPFRPLDSRTGNAPIIA